MRCFLFSLAQECLRAVSRPACLQCFSHQHLTPGPRAPRGGLVAAQGGDGGEGMIRVCVGSVFSFRRRLDPARLGGEDEVPGRPSSFFFSPQVAQRGQRQKERCVRARTVRGLKGS